MSARQATFIEGQVLKDYALTRLATLRGPVAGGTTMPLPVRHEFGKMAAVKLLAWIGEDGYPVVASMLSLHPAGKSTVVCRRGQLPSPPDSASVATNVLTLDAISYQAKGEWLLKGDIGAVRVGEVYAGGPPYPGGRIV